MIISKKQFNIVFIIITVAIFLGIIFYKPKKMTIAHYDYTKSIQTNLKWIESNRVIIIGDSRFKRIINERENYSIPQNYLFIAKSATAFEWFKEEAIPKMKMLIDNKHSYHIIINMGINDIQFTQNYHKIINKYLIEFKKLEKEYPGINFYILSINPIDEELININYPENIRTMNKIEIFNNKLIYFSKNSKYKYCDSANNINFETLDGLHYKNTTNQEIIKYILTKI